jgi:diguanylate cyclase (GGDEF)-like protein
VPTADPSHSPTCRVVALTLLLALTAATVSAAAVGPLEPLAAPLRPPWWLLALGFAVAEVFVVHLHLRQGAYSVSLGELPLVLGLFLLDPGWLMVSAITGSAVALALHQRQPPLKLAFNAAHFWLEVSLAVAVFHAVLGGADPLGPGGWAAAFAATATADLAGATAITLVVALYEARAPGRSTAAVFITSAIAALTNTSLALLVVLVLWTHIDAAWLLLVVAVILFLAYRAYGALRQRHESVQALYGFTGAVGQALDIDIAIATLLEHARGILTSETAELRMLASDGTALGRTILDNMGLRHIAAGDADPLADLSRQVTASGRGLVGAKTVKSPRLREQLAQAGLRDLLVAPLRAGGGVVGTLLVANHVPDVETYDEGDLQLFETVANHAGVALENGRLVERLRQEADEKEYRASHDGLTGLANRALFSAEVQGAIHAGEAVAVLLLDLDRFKEINDTLGHGNGDQLLRELAGRLHAALGPQRCVARLGGDEFAVLVRSAAGVHEALEAAAVVHQVLGSPFEIAGLALDVAASIGVALGPEHGSDATLLLQRADVAMYLAKAERSGVEVYAPERDQYSPARLALVGDLRHAILAGGLEVHYQPKAMLASGRVTGAEALLRWEHPRHGRVSPEDFVPIAEHSGLIRPLTLYVLEQALRDAARWHRRGLDLHVAVNLSTRSLLDVHLPDDVAGLLAATGVDAAALTLEITEGTAMRDPVRTAQVLRRLSALGVGLAIDDFGSGYSSLAYLKRLPVTELKIDKSFVLSMASNLSDAVIVRSTVDLARNLGLRAVAEGVEDEATWERLVDIGCDIAQGYFLSRPVDAHSFMCWALERQRSGTSGRRQAATALAPGSPSRIE